MHQLIYVSAAAVTLDQAVLTDILAASRRNNPRCGVTGVLLQINDGFLQILEGTEDAVRQTYARIHADRRHTATHVLIDQSVDTRLFPNWTMGFERPLEGHPDTGGIFQASRAAVEGVVSEDQAIEIAILLRTFYRVNARKHAA